MTTKYCLAGMVTYEGDYYVTHYKTPVWIRLTCSSHESGTEKEEIKEEMKKEKKENKK